MLLETCRIVYVAILVQLGVKSAIGDRDILKQAFSVRMPVPVPVQDFKVWWWLGGEVLADRPGFWDRRVGGCIPEAIQLPSPPRASFQSSKAKGFGKCPLRYLYHIA